MDSDDVATGCDCGRVHVLHVSQIAAMSSISLITSGGWFAAVRSIFICAAVACHHRKCSLRNSRRLAPSSAVRRALAVRCVGASPVDASW